MTIVLLILLLLVPLAIVVACSSSGEETNATGGVQSMSERGIDNSHIKNLT